MANPNATPGGQVLRDFVIFNNPKTGVTVIAGGKWTTWREMAEDVLDKVLGEEHPKCNTLDITLHGGMDIRKAFQFSSFRSTAGWKMLRR